MTEYTELKLPELERVQPAPMTAVLSRMLNLRNIDPSVRPDITSKSKDDEKKVAFINDVIVVNTDIAQEKYKTNKEEMHQFYGQVALLTAFLHDESDEEFIQLSKSGKNRDKLLKFVSHMTREYSNRMLNDPVGTESIFKSAEDNPYYEQFADVIPTAPRYPEAQVTLEGFESLYNTLIDLKESGAISENHTVGLLILFEEIKPEVTIDNIEKVKAVIDMSRRLLRNDIERSIALNNGPKDNRLDVGRKIISMLTISKNLEITSGKKFRVIQDIIPEVKINYYSIKTDQQARAFIKSRIGYFLDKLYNDN